MAGGGRRRHVGGDGVVGEHREARAHSLGYPARREAVCGGATTAAGGGDGSGAPATVGAKKEAQEGQSGEGKVMARSAWTKEGLNSGDAARPSSAMAAMATAVVPDRAGLGKRARGMNGGKVEMLARSTRLRTERRSGHGSGTSST
jgi:hypothetical protein